jgi:hypothetical protein
MDCPGQEVGYVLDDDVHLKFIVCLDGDAVLDGADAHRCVALSAGVDGQRRVVRGGAARSNVLRDSRN